jgi:phosphoribosylformylglycinamidine (FGAM) synthase-like enzyme
MYLLEEKKCLYINSNHCPYKRSFSALSLLKSFELILLYIDKSITKKKKKKKEKERGIENKNVKQKNKQVETHTHRYRRIHLEETL